MHLHLDDDKSVISNFFEDDLYLDFRDIEQNLSTWNSEQGEIEYQRLRAKFNFIRRRFHLFLKNVKVEISSIHTELIKKLKKC